MRVRIINFGTNWWVMHSGEISDPLCFVRKAAYFNAAALKSGRRLHHSAIFRGDVVLYLTSGRNVLYLLALEMHGVAKRIGLALSESFRRDLLDAYLAGSQPSITLPEVLVWHQLNTIRLQPVYVPEYHKDETTAGYLRRFSTGFASSRRMPISERSISRPAGVRYDLRPRAQNELHHAPRRQLGADCGSTFLSAPRRRAAVELLLLTGNCWLQLGRSASSLTRPLQFVRLSFPFGGCAALFNPRR